MKPRKIDAKGKALPFRLTRRINQKNKSRTHISKHFFSSLTPTSPLIRTTVTPSPCNPSSFPPPPPLYLISGGCAPFKRRMLFFVRCPLSALRNKKKKKKNEKRGDLHWGRISLSLFFPSPNTIQYTISPLRGRLTPFARPPQHRRWLLMCCLQSADINVPHQREALLRTSFSPPPHSSLTSFNTAHSTTRERTKFFNDNLL